MVRISIFDHTVVTESEKKKEVFIMKQLSFEGFVDEEIILEFNKTYLSLSSEEFKRQFLNIVKNQAKLEKRWRIFSYAETFENRWKF